MTIIFPFNWPLAILAASLPYALMAGNTVVAKPPPTTPLSSVMTLRHLARGLPPGVLNVITGQDAVVGPIVVGDPRVKHVCFTGSVGGGRRIMSMAAANLTNVTLELGGNDPAVVLDDARSTRQTIGRIAGATFRTDRSGLHGDQAPVRPRARLRRRRRWPARALEDSRVGCGLNPEVTMGPLHTVRQRDFVIELVEEARAAGTEVIEFGEYIDPRPSDGNYALPSLVLEPSSDLRIVTEEQFGPNLPVIPYDSEEQAIAMANDTWAGLCSSVWSWRRRTRDGGRQTAAQRRHLLQQPQRHRGR